MPRIISTWLVGSLERVAEQPITFDGVSRTIESAPYYLVHQNPALSLLDRIATELTAAGVPGATAVVMENRHVRISAAVPFAISWGAGDQIRDLLGFGANLAGLESYDAPRVSPLLWSAGGTVNRAVPRGIVGHEVEDITLTVSADGSRQFTDHHATHVWDTWQWPSVYLDRYNTPDGAGGTWMAFRRQVARHGHRLQLYELVVEDVASTDPVSLPVPVGTYRIREPPPGKGKRKIKTSDVYWGVRVDVRQTPDYS